MTNTTATSLGERLNARASHIEALRALLQEAAAECLKSSQGNGDYNAAFYVAHIVLTDIVRRVGESCPSTPIEKGGAR